MRLGRYEFRAMGSPCELKLYGAVGDALDPVAEAGIREVRRLERKYSRYRDDSLLSAINRSAGDPQGIDVDPETSGLLDFAETCFRHSEGLFDITSGVLRHVGDFRSGRLPTRQAVNAVRGRIGWQRVHWKRPRLVLPDHDMELDLGGLVKEYAVDRCAERCRALGVSRGLVDLGGDLAAIGPHPDGHPWIVGIRDPRRPREALASIPVGRACVASSGNYERFMIVDGVRYGHILDPRTDWPVSGLAGVSVVAPLCLIAGTASTIAMLKGERDGSAWLDSLGLANLRVTQSGVVSGTLQKSTRTPLSRPTNEGSVRCGSGGRSDPRS